MNAEEIKENKFRVKREIEAVEREIWAWEERKSELYGLLRYFQTMIPDEERRPLNSATTAINFVHAVCGKTKPHPAEVCAECLKGHTGIGL